MPPLSTPLADSKFNLNSAGVAGFFGGEEAISAMATVHLFEGRRWLGWFNSPGSYTVAKRFGRMANSRFWDGLFPGSNDSPALTFGLDGQKGPQYIAALSGTTMNAGHLAYLTMERIKELHEEEIEGRKTSTFDVAYLAMNEVDLNVPIKLEPLLNALFGLFPIAVSVAACVVCALVYDWFSFSMTLLGIISSGLASLVIGEGKLSITSVKPAKGAPPGHGLLIGESEITVIKGREQDVNVITKGRFYLKTGSNHNDGKKGGDKDGKKKGDEKRSATNGDLERGKTEISLEKKKKSTENYHMIGVSSLFLLLQFLLQLLLVPQGTLFGQTLFLVSLGVSWAYNSYLSSLEKEKTQTEILWRVIKPQQMLRFCTGTRTTMAVFVCLLVFHGVPRSSSIEEDREYRVRILNQCVPNDTAVWKRWRDKVVDQLLSIDDTSELLPHLKVDEEDPDSKLPDSCKPLLQTLLLDAEAAFKGYFRVRHELPIDSSHPKVKGDQANLH